MRYIELNDGKLKDILTQRGIVFEQVRKVNEEIVRLDGERTKLGYKMDKLKDKTADILKDNPQELSEFEEIGRVYIEDGKVMLEIFDKIEEYKKMLREKDESPK
jgi:hypothetical protein